MSDNFHVDQIDRAELLISLFALWAWAEYISNLQQDFAYLSANLKF